MHVVCAQGERGETSEKHHDLPVCVVGQAVMDTWMIAGW